MIKTGQSNSINLKKIIKKIKIKKRKESSNKGFQNNIRSSNLDNDIFVGLSGQAKIDNLDSCLDLDDCDFIVF